MVQVILLWWPLKTSKQTCVAIGGDYTLPLPLSFEHCLSAAPIQCCGSFEMFARGTDSVTVKALVIPTSSDIQQTILIDGDDEVRARSSKRERRDSKRFV